MTRHYLREARSEASFWPIGFAASIGVRAHLSLRHRRRPGS